jgi:signal transduction histidine kinase
MTQTSATKSGSQAQVSDVLATIARRASHEVRNALNGVAVNIEVVRSRLAKPGSDTGELQTFADRASGESDAAASLTNGLADLARLFARAATGDGQSSISTADGSTMIQVPICSSDDNSVSSDLQALAGRMGVQIKLDGPTVIFTVRD